MIDCIAEQRMNWIRSLSKQELEQEISKFLKSIGWNKCLDEPVYKVTEKDIEDWFCDYLKSQGRVFDRQVQCAAGIIDILCPDMIYEVKLDLTRASIIKAIGQLMLYRQAINPCVHLTIVGRATEEIKRIRPFVEACGVRAIAWENKEWHT